MWRFIIVTFAFLGWSFYVLSGGADYKPADHSLQAQAKIDKTRPNARPKKLAVAGAETGQDETLSRGFTTLGALEPADGNRFKVTLASVSADATPDIANTADPQKIEILTRALDEATPEVTASETDAAVALALAADQRDSAPDIREITGNVVNMRDGPGTSFLKIDQLTKGTEVEVLHDSGEGWLELKVVETGEIGWIADWLVTASAN